MDPLTSQISYSIGNVCNLNPSIYAIVSFEMLNSNTIVMMQIVLGIYVYDISGYFSNKGSDCSQTQFKLLYQISNKTIGGKIILSSDKKYLYASFKSVGIYIYEITEQQATQIQIIWQQGDASYLLLAQNDQILLSTNSQSLLGYQATKPNLNNSLPNLLLNYQQMQLASVAENSSNMERDCMFSEKTNLLFVASPSQSFLVMKYVGNGILESYYLQLGSGISFIVFAIILDDQKTTIAATKDNGIMIIDFSNLSTPIILKEGITFNIDKINLNSMQISSDGSILVLIDNTRAIFVDIANPTSPQLISVYDITIDGGIPPLKRAAFSVDNKTIYLGTETDSIISLNISKLVTPIFLQKLFVDGLKELRVTQDGKNLIFAQVYKGMVVLDIQNPANMKIITSVSVRGAAISVQLIYNDQFILMTSTGNPSIKLIDFRDRLNPVGIQLLHIQNHSYEFFSICKADADQTIFITTNENIVILNLKNTLNMHTQVYLVQQNLTSSTKKLQMIEQDQTFLVGQQIQFNFLNVKDIALVQIQDAFHYINDQIQQLPSWAVFSSISKELNLQITKESLYSNGISNNYNSVNGVNQQFSSQQIILKVNRQILDDAFINSHFQITLSQSLLLKKSCIKGRYIDSDFFLSQWFEPFGYFQLDQADLNQLSNDQNVQQQILNFVQLVLKRSIIYYTISFQIQPSLKIDFNNLKEPISSIQTQISFYLSCADPSQGKFVYTIYSSVLVVYSEYQNQIKIEGSLSNINTILNNKIKFTNSTEINQIKFLLQVSDGVNFDFIQEYNYNQLPIISLQKKVEIEQQHTLQDYFNQRFSQGQLSINRYFSFQIPNGHYLSDDNYPLTFKAYLLSKQEYNKLTESNSGLTNSQIEPEILPKQLWIQFSSTDQVFSGLPASDVLFNQYYIMINVTDGYTFVLEPLQIDVNQIPFSFMIQLIIQILGPLFGLLGLWKYRYIYMNLFCKKHYMYSKECVFVDQEFEKHIYIYGKTLSISQAISNQIFPEIFPSSFINYQINLFLNQNNQSMERSKNQGSMNSKLSKLYHNNSLDVVIQQTSPVKIRSPSIKFENFRASQLNNSKNDIEARQKNNKNSFHLLTSNIFIETKKLEKKIAKSQRQKESSLSQICQLFESNGHINKPFVLEKIKKQLEAQKKKKYVKIIDQLNIPNSSFSNIFYGLFVHYILEKMKAAQCIFKYMKEQACVFIKTKDWYKEYVDIIQSPIHEEIYFFDQFQINENTFQKVFEETVQRIQNINEKKKNKIDISFNSFQFLIPLVKDTLVATAQGISFEKAGYTFKSQGECINCEQHSIKMIKAFQKQKQNSICKNKKFEYKEKFLIHNQLIPTWIKNIEFIDNIIIIQGIPKKQDIGTTLFRVYNENNIVQFAFEVEVLINPNQQSTNTYQDLQQNKKQLFTTTSLFNLQINSKQKQGFNKNTEKYQEDEFMTISIDQDKPFTPPTLNTHKNQKNFFDC